ncbi:hypothetical protein P0M11_05200 [Kaistella sp. PBT33-4]|uniref:hypothetical protein n=1 Tax=Kaistella sp. PBT33-4 TaxID=3032000 RepID=UPI0023D82F8E|nr:hypothetical protein [Kaistella sp. PBT33-4]MDF0719393.1 hypothetical protein [Kaistella sp. PBT33-4]
MKKLSYLLVLFFLAVAIQSCRDNHTEPFYDGEPVLHFQKESAEVNATDVGFTDYVVEFGTIAPVAAGTTVTLVKKGGDAVEGTDYEVLGGNTTQVAAGAVNGSFTVRVFGAGLSPDTAKTLVLGLQSSQIANAVYNQEITLSMRMKCPLPSNFPLTYNVSVYAFNEDAPSHTQTLVPVPGTDNQFTIASSWGPNFVAWATNTPSYANQYLYPGVITINCGDVTFTTSAAYGSNTTGTYDPTTGVIQFAVQQSLFSTQFTTNITLTPQ